MSYTYQTDEPKISALVFGLNTGAKMVKFEFNPNGGKDNAEQECLDIVFEVNGKEVSYRKFPVTKAIDKDTKLEVTNPAHPAMVQAFNEFNAIITHIVTCFIPKEEYSKALSKPTNSFKEFCVTVMNVLPKDFSTKSLDIFAQYQFNLKGENTQTYVEIPKSLKHGKFLCPSVVPVGDEWKEVRMSEPSDLAKNALYYKDSAGNIHPFIRTGWFVKSNFANKQKEEVNDLGASASNDDAPEAGHADGGTW